MSVYSLTAVIQPGQPLNRYTALKHTAALAVQVKSKLKTSAQAIHELQFMQKIFDEPQQWLLKDDLVKALKEVPLQIANLSSISLINVLEKANQIRGQIDLISLFEAIQNSKLTEQSRNFMLSAGINEHTVQRLEKSSFWIVAYEKTKGDSSEPEEEWFKRSESVVEYTFAESKLSKDFGTGTKPIRLCEVLDYWCLQQMQAPDPAIAKMCTRQTMANWDKRIKLFNRRLLPDFYCPYVAAFRNIVGGVNNQS